MKKRRVMIFIISAILILNMVFNFDLRVEAASQNEVVAQLNSLINQYNEKTATANQMIDGKQCKGFANWVFFKLFGAHIGAYPESANYKISNPNAQTLGIIEPGNLNVNTAKSLLQKGAPGDYIQMQRSTARGRGPHSMILVGVNDSGIEVFDCNSDGKNTIKNYTISWESLDVANRAMSLYRAYGYSPSSGTSSVQPGLPDKPVITNLQPVYTNTNTINLTWTAASRAVSYYIDVWKNESEHIFSSDVGNVTSYTLGCFGSDGKYNIAVSALNSAGISYGDYSYTNVLYVADLGGNFHANIALGDSDSLVSAADNGNVEIQTSGGSSNQGWEFQHQSDGSYKIVSTNGSGKCLDVHNYGGSESNVSIVTDNGGPAQRWYIRESSGYYLLTPACAPDCSLDVVGASKTDGTNVNIYWTNRGAAQQLLITKIEAPSEKPAMSELKSVYINTNTIKLRWDKVERATSYYIDVWKDGKHIFSSDIGNVTSYDLDCFGSDGKYNIAVSALNSAGISYGDYSYTNVLYVADLGKNFHANIALGDSDSLVSAADNGNVEIQTSGGSLNQGWEFQHQSDGSYKIVSTNGSGKCLDVHNYGGSESNVSIVTDNGGAAQRWYIRESSGYYLLTPACAPDCSLDVVGASKTDGTNVNIYSTNRGAAQQLSIRKIEVSSEKPAMSELKSVYTNTDTIKLSWDKIERATSYYIDVWRDGKHIFSSDIGNVTSYDLDCFDSDGKYGITVSAQNIAGIMDGDCFYTYVLHGVNVGDNFDAYIVHSESGKAIAVDDKDNIELQTFDDSRQLWNFQLQSDGSYKIINKNGTKKCLHSSGKQTNVSIVGDNGEPAQRWLIREAGGYYVFTSLYAPDCSLDVGDNPKSDGSVVQTLTTEQNASQLFRIIPSSEEPVCRHDYKQFIKKQETCIETGVKEYVCSKCGDSYIESIPPTGHTWDKGKVTIKATASTDGIYTYTCILCGETKTEKIPATGQTDQNDEDKDKTETGEGKKPDVDGTDKDEDENDSDEEEPDTDDGEESDALDVGDITEDAKSGDEYEIISNNRDVICVKYIESANPKAMIVKIPATIETEEGKVCKVTSISKSAFKNNRKLKKVVIGENVSAIGTKAFFGCKNLSTVTIGKNVVSIGAGAFSNCTKLTRLTIPAKVTRIGANAFSGCKKLRKLEIKSRKLNSKGLNKKSFKGIPKKTLIRVPMDKRKVYKKLLCQKGLRKSNKIR